MPQGDGLKILVADELAKEGLEMLKSSGIAFDVKVGMKEDELTSAVPSYDALIVRSGAKVTAKVMGNPGKLKVIARAGVGVDNIHLPTATEKGILVLNTAAASTLSTAEHALALMMAPPSATKSPKMVSTNSITIIEMTRGKIR